jgi:hypothetical protein
MSTIIYCSQPNCSLTKVLLHHHCNFPGCTHKFVPTYVHDVNCELHPNNFDQYRDRGGRYTPEPYDCYCQTSHSIIEYHNHCAAPNCQKTDFHVHCGFTGCLETNLHTHCNRPDCNWVGTQSTVLFHQHCPIKECNLTNPHHHCNTCQIVLTGAFHQHCTWIGCDRFEDPHKHCNICKGIFQQNVWHEHCAFPGCKITENPHTHCNYPNCTNIASAGQFHQHCKKDHCDRIDNDRWRRHKHCNKQGCGHIKEPGEYHLHCSVLQCNRTDQHRHCKQCNDVFNGGAVVHKHCRKCKMVKNVNCHCV